jgi:putative glycerol-1-phosphate prenyltransferase
LDAGSGALNPVASSMISAVNAAIDIPLIVGGGIKTPEAARKAAISGADIIVVGNAIEKDPSLIMELSAAVHL